jgi:ubiquinone/menaquinone biosynthesis C-methylase UbiE
MSKSGEFILRQLSRNPSSPDYVWAEHVEQRLIDINTSKQRVEHTFPNFKNAVLDKSILDIGCGKGGLEAIAISLLGAKEVTGIDIHLDMEQAKNYKNKLAPDRLVEFCLTDAHHTSFTDSKFDAIITLDAFEHFRDPFKVLEESKRILKEKGKIFLTSGVWGSPRGAHMSYFTKVPWIQFLFSEETIINVRSLYRNDGAKIFSEVKGGLNKIGIRRFKQYAEKLNLEIEYLSLNPVKGLTFLTKIPVVNEFFTNWFTAVLRK